MRKIWLALVVLSAVSLIPQSAAADGVNGGLGDQTVVPIVRTDPTTGAPMTSVVRVDPVTGQTLIFGSNQVGRPGVDPDQIGGYDVNIAYDHVAVGVGIMAVLFLMTEWMDAR